MQRHSPRDFALLTLRCACAGFLKRRGLPATTKQRSNTARMKSILGLLAALAAAARLRACAWLMSQRPGAGWLDAQWLFLAALPYNWTMPARARRIQFHAGLAHAGRGRARVRRRRSPTSPAPLSRASRGCCAFGAAHAAASAEHEFEVLHSRARRALAEIVELGDQHRLPARLVGEHVDFERVGAVERLGLDARLAPAAATRT